MANERNPLQTPLTPIPNNMSQKQPAPEFGKPSVPQSPLVQKARKPDHESSLFRIPQPGQKRPEHHVPVRHNPLSMAKDWAKGQIQKVAESQAPSKSQSTFDPYRPQGFRPTSTVDSDDVVEVPRPSGYKTWATPKAPRPTFSSRGDDIIDLTRGNDRPLSQPNFFNDGLSMSDPSMYIDAAKANDNLKALLEGAFEDEDDKPRTRSRKNKLDKAADDLADQLMGLNVKDKTEADNAKPEEEEEEEEDDGTIEGLKVKLLPHQIEGVNWMRAKETGKKKTRGVHPKGGILADDMGLGKTIQSIALILTNPLPKDYSPKPPSKEEAKKADKEKLQLSPGLDKGTLVVAPLALIKQWEAEIKDRVEESHALKVKVHHGPQRAKLSADLKKFDVVITTYQILVSEHASSGDNVKAGVFGVNWLRIILDEAHTIKNRNAKATQATYALNAEYRWCLTGTPMQNNLDELQSLIRFLRIKPYDDLATWRDQISRPMNSGRGGLAIRRLQVYLKAFMKRRTKDVLKQEGALKGGSSGKAQEGKSSGFKIVKRTVEEVQAEFTDEERLFYDRLEQRADRSLESMMKRDALTFASALVLLLRLRQACNHPQLVKSDLTQEKETFSGSASGLQSPRKKAAVKADDIDGIADLLGGLSMETKKCDVCQIELTAKESAAGVIRCSECEVDLADEESAARKMKDPKKKKHKKTKKAKKSTEAKSEEPKRSRVTARRAIIDSDDEDDEGEWIVPDEQRSPTKLGKAGGSDDENAEGGGEWLVSEDSEDDDDSEEDDEDEDIKPIQRKKDVVDLVSDDNEESSETEDDDEDEEDSDLYEDDQVEAQKLVYSTKIRELIRILRNDSAEHKYIIFSFFTSMLDVIEPFLRRENLAFTRYDGSMRNDLREASLDRLRNHDGTRILLCSLRAGSLGLNLTAASRVVILEPFWNPFVEEQAIDRVHRLNQTKDVIVYKLTVKDTVEARIVELQNRKRELANATIEGNKNAAGKLTLKDMLALFRHDAESSAKIDGIGMSVPGQNLMSRGAGKDDTQAAEGPDMAAQSRRREKFSPPVSNKRAEHAIYGRRW